MITILLVVLFTFLKSIADTIKVPSTFDNSWFVRFKGKYWIDPLVTKPEPQNFLIRPFVAMFRDLWHTCWTLNICILFIFGPAYAHSELYPSFPILFVMWWFVYGYCFEWFLSLWRFFK